MTDKLKYRLPLYSELSFANMTAELLCAWQKMVSEHDQDFSSALAANSQLCRFHSELTQSTYNNLLQISLTDSIYQNQDIDFDNFSQLPSLGSFKEKIKLARNESSAFSEHSFVKPNDMHVRYQDLINKTLQNFQSQITRTRLVKLTAGTSITPHIDYDPSYAVRIIYPIISPKDCLNIFWRKNTVETIHLTPGVAYFLNTGFRHAVVNLSNQSRYTLMITLNGAQDIQHILKD